MEVSRRGDLVADAEGGGRHLGDECAAAPGDALEPGEVAVEDGLGGDRLSGASDRAVRHLAGEHLDPAALEPRNERAVMVEIIAASRD
ncbi:MAG: hypothetical protein LC732_09655 [Acidobacteria bacterium]|nr:hypothetical protein [Acidobacteriota bacterium]